MEQLEKSYKRHIFVCVNERENKECCAQKNGMTILRKLRSHINDNGLFHKYNITKTKCLGHCKDGPVLVVYPEGIFFVKVTEQDVDAIISHYLQ